MKEYKDYAKITAHFDLAIEEAVKFGGNVGKNVILLFETMKWKLDAIPAADVVEVKHAEWNATGRCTNCGGHAPYYGMSDEYYESPYCFECGAKMGAKKKCDLLFATLEEIIDAAE